MMDPIAAAYDSAARGAAFAPALALLAGAATALGPCVAPRMIAIAALSAGTTSVRRRWLLLGAIVAGMTVSYGAVATASSLVTALSGYSGWIYLAMSVGFGVGAYRSLVESRHAHSCNRSVTQRSLGGAFFVGCSFGFMISPCCTPIVAAIGTLGAAAQNPLFAAAVLGAFVVGHALPLAVIVCGAGKLYATLERPQLRSAIALVTGGLLLFLSGYYAVLA